jgi:carboxypeptidase C (cathepsin A)
VRVLVYSGDTDPCINTFWSQNWTSHLGFEETQAWRPWTTDGAQAMGGYVTRYAQGFDFLTIRGSGHMVPEFRPKQTLEWLRRWLGDEDWQRYARPA